MKKYLITGATGFVGNHLINELLKHNIEVIATSIEAPDQIKSFQWANKVHYIQFDLNKPHPNYFQLFKKPDHLIHLAWEGLPNYKESFHMDRNLVNNFNFIKQIISEGLKNLTVLGTCLEYGMMEGCLSEDMETKPSNAYALAKDTLRKYIQELKKMNDFNFNWIRAFYLYGEGQNPNSLLSSLEQSLKNGDTVFNMSKGNQIRDFIKIKEACRIITRLSFLEKEYGIVNCCSGEPITAKQMVESYLKKNNKNIKLNLGYYPYSDIEPFSFWGDRTKLDCLLNSS